MATKVEKKSLVERIMSFLGLDDAGKLQKFFDREKRQAERAVKNLESNNDTIKREYDNYVDELKDKLVDAEEAFEAAKLEVSPKDVVSHEAMDKFSSVYWGNLSHKKDIISDIKDQMEEVKDTYEAEKKDNDDQIKAYKERIKVITELK